LHKWTSSVAFTRTTMLKEEGSIPLFFLASLVVVRDLDLLDMALSCEPIFVYKANHGGVELTVRKNNNVNWRIIYGNILDNLDLLFQIVVANGHYVAPKPGHYFILVKWHIRHLQRRWRIIGKLRCL
jgi:hypothetical protein